MNSLNENAFRYFDRKVRAVVVPPPPTELLSGGQQVRAPAVSAEGLPRRGWLAMAASALLAVSGLFAAVEISSGAVGSQTLSHSIRAVWEVSGLDTEIASGMSALARSFKDYTSKKLEEP